MPTKSKSTGAKKASPRLLMEVEARKTEFSRIIDTPLTISFGDGEKPVYIGITLIDLFQGQKTVPDWFDEFRLDSVKVSLVGVKSTSGDPPPFIEFVSSPEYNTSVPTNIAELRRMAGRKSLLYNFAKPRNNITKLFSTTNPVFDVTGSNNDFVNRWIPTTNNAKTTWTVGVLAPGYLGSNTGIEVSLSLRTHIHFRGFQ